MSTAIGVLSFAGLSSDPWFSATLMACPSASIAFRKAGFRCPRITRHPVAEDQVEDRSDGITGCAGDRGCPFWIDTRHFDRAQEIEYADNEDERRVLEQTDIGIDDIRDRHFQRLRKYDQPHHLPIAQAYRHGPLILAPRDGLQARAYDFRHIGGRKNRDADESAHQFIGRQLLR